jgi:hypothetical protein
MAMRTVTICCFIVMVSIVNIANSQNYLLDGSTGAEIRNEQNIYSGSFFPSVRPWISGELFSSDSINSTLPDTLFFPLLSTGNLWKFKARIEPYMESSADLSAGNILLSHSAVGITVMSSYNKLMFQGSLRTGSMNPLGIARYYADSLHILPGLGMIGDLSRSSFSYLLPRMSFNADVSENFSAEAGIGTHFFGDGKRSLILSDEHYPYPYLKLTTEIWKLRYVNLFAWQRDVQSTGASLWKDGIYKFNAMHYLSWNVTKRLNLSVFEAIVCPLHDSLMQRQFVEYNYLLPVVMYRPLDFALGSPDNVLIGMNASLTAGNHVIYGQLVMDEMFMNEIRADMLQFFFPDSARQHGAWVNKQAVQLGWKHYDMFGIDHLDGLAEVNVIRPFIYAHRDVQQNYTHLNQPLAHPLGSNLIELTGRFRYTGEKWFARFEFSLVKTGLDSSGALFGNNIFRPTFDSPIAGLDNIPVQYYGNTITQGIPCRIYYFSASASRVLVPQYNIRAEFGLSIRSITVETTKNSSAYVHLGIKWGIGNQRYGL